MSQMSTNERDKIPAPDDSANHDFYGTEKWCRDFEERVNRSLKEHKEQFKIIKELMQLAIAKMQAMDEEKEKWLEIYSNPRLCTNFIEGGDYDNKTQEHQQESQPWPA